MKPLDPRLLRYARSSRAFLAVGAFLGLGQTVAMVAFAWLVASVVTGAMAGRDTLELAGMLWAMVGVVAARGLMQWGMDWAGARAAATAKSELRSELMLAVADLGPHRLGGRSIATVTTLASHGLDALDNYFGKYLPQLLLTVIATPILVVVTLVIDPVSGITELVTLPVIPFFMVLIGLATRRAQRGQMDALTSLANAFLELVEGLSTLKIFGRAGRQTARIRTITDDYRRSTMKVLRISFLSGFALELFASLAVALVAVQIGIRLIDNEMVLFVGLFALILAPEVFQPLRQVGAQFHAAAEGVEAANDVFALIELRDRDAKADLAAVTATAASAAAQTPVAAGLEPVGLALRAVTVRYGEHTVLDDLDFDLARGSVTAIAGESGVGKSTLLAYLRGAIRGDGRRFLDGVPLSAAEIAARTSWMGQSAALMEGTVAANVGLGMPDLPERVVREQLAAVGLADIPPQRILGVGGAGLSGGQAQRVSFARALARIHTLDTPIAIFDEPSSALDAEREQLIVGELRRLATEGRVVIVVSHRRAVLGAADRVVRLEPAPSVRQT